LEHRHDHDHHKNQNNIKAAFLLNFSFAIFEIAGGIWTNSLAIISDAVHDLGDSLSLGVAWFLERYSGKGPDTKFSFGYARFSLLGALINSLILISGSVIILSQAIPKIFTPEEVNPAGMLVFAIIGIVVNGIGFLRLKKGTSFNEITVSWHLLEDVLGWTAVLTAAVVLLFADIPVIDPLLSVLISLFVLYNVLKNLKRIIYIFLQGVPENLSIAEVEKNISDITGALKCYHTHIWSLEGEKNLLSTHIIVKDGISREEIVFLKNQVRKLMRDKGIDHVTLEIEYESEFKEEDSNYKF